MVKLYARLHETKVKGFYFKTAKEYEEKIAKREKLAGKQTEKVEIIFIEGEVIDNEMFETLKIHPGYLEDYLKIVEQSSCEDKIKLIICAQVMGSFFRAWREAKEWDIEIYEFDSLKDLAIHRIQGELYGDIDEGLKGRYIDYQTMVCKLTRDYGEATVLGKNYIYRSVINPKRSKETV